MEIAIKILASALVIAGAGGATSVALWQTGYIGGGNNAEGSSLVNTQANHSEQADSSANSTSSGVSEDDSDFWQTRQQTIPQTSSITPKDNCKVLDESTWKTVIEKLSRVNGGYIVISCDNEGTSFKTKWTGFFPNGLIEENITEGEKLTITAYKEDIDEEDDEVETETDDFDASYRTTFKGKVFDGEKLVGKWGYQTKSIGDKSLTIFREEDSDEEFYLLFDNQSTSN